MKKDNNIEFIRIPRTVVQLGEEVKRAVDLYWDRELKHDELKKLIIEWTNTGMLLEANKLNKTVKKIIGKKRERVVHMMLEGYQYKL